MLIVFLLSASIAYISAGGSAKGDLLSRCIMLLTLITVPLNYLLFLYHYFKELGTVLFSKKVFVLYLFPTINILFELFRSRLSFGDFIPKFNLISFFLLFLIVAYYFIVILRRNKDTDQAHIIKVLVVINILAFSPFLCLYLIPYVFFNDYYVSSFLTASFMLLIPFSLVYQFMSNKIYNVDFILSKLKYYGFLALTPTIILVTTIELLREPEENFYNLKLTFLIYILMLAVFYYKEILDFRFKLKRVSERFNYQDSIYKFTQLIRNSSSLNQVFGELKTTILEVTLTSKVYIFEVTYDGNVKAFDERDSSLIDDYQVLLNSVTVEIGKITEFNQGFAMKVGERGDRSFVVLCLSKMNTPRLSREEISWLKTLSFYVNVSIENVMKIEELMNHLEDLKKQETNPVWLKKLMFTIEEKQRSDFTWICMIRCCRI